MTNEAANPDAETPALAQTALDMHEREQLRIAHDQEHPEFVEHDEGCQSDPATCYRCFLEEA